MPVIKLKGLPWSCTQEDIRRFLDGVKIAPKRNFEESESAENNNVDSNNPGIYLTMNSEGRPSGQAFVEVETDEDLEAARSKHQAKIGQRYIEVFKSNSEELMNDLKASLTNASNWNDPVVRLRGLPFSCQESDIRQFFEGLDIARSDGVLMVQDFSGRFNGEGFVRFEHMQDAHRALDKHKQKIGTRYIEVFRSTTDEMQYYWSNMKNLADNDNNGYSSGGGGKTRRPPNIHHNVVNNTSNRYSPYSRNINNNRFIKSTSNYSSNGNYFKQDGPVGYASQPSGLQSLLNLEPSSFGGPTSYNQFDDRGNSSHSDIDEEEHESGACVKMRGLPYNATEHDIRQFFSPLNVSGVEILYGRDRRPSGECICYFATKSDSDSALGYNKRYMGKRYIEIFEYHGRNDAGYRGNGGRSVRNYESIGRGGDNDRTSPALNSQRPVVNQFDPTAFFNQEAMAEMAKKFLESALQAAASQQFGTQQSSFNSSAPRSKRF